MAMLGLAVTAQGGATVFLARWRRHSLLGVAGGEVIIPSLVLAYGVDQDSGYGQLVGQLPTVLTGIGRYARRCAYADRAALTKTVAPMGVGSVLRAVRGGLLVGLVPANALNTLVRALNAILRHMSPWQSQAAEPQRASQTIQLLCGFGG